MRLGFGGVSVVVVGFLYDFLTMRDLRLISFMSSQTKRSPTSVFKMNRKNAAMRLLLAGMPIFPLIISASSYLQS